MKNINDLNLGSIFSGTLRFILKFELVFAISGSISPMKEFLSSSVSKMSYSLEALW